MLDRAPFILFYSSGEVTSDIHCKGISEKQKLFSLKMCGTFPDYYLLDKDVGKCSQIGNYDESIT